MATMDKNIPKRRRRKQEKAHRGVKTNPTGSGGWQVLGEGERWDLGVSGGASDSPLPCRAIKVEVYDWDRDGR